MEEKDLKDNMRLENLTDAQKAKMKVTHYTMHLPASISKEQYEFIQGIAQCVLRNEPIVTIDERALQYALRIIMLYRNVLMEFDEGNRWKPEDETMFRVLYEEFKGMAEYIQKEHRITVRRLDES